MKGQFALEFLAFQFRRLESGGFANCLWWTLPRNRASQLQNGDWSSVKVFVLKNLIVLSGAWQILLRHCVRGPPSHGRGFAMGSWFCLYCKCAWNSLTCCPGGLQATLFSNFVWFFIWEAHKTKENYLKHSPCTQCTTKRFSRLLAASSHIKPSKRLSCQGGPSKPPTKDKKWALGDPHPVQTGYALSFAGRALGDQTKILERLIRDDVTIAGSVVGSHRSGSEVGCRLREGHLGSIPAAAQP